MNKKARYILWLSDVEKEDITLVGGKGANLGEMTRAGFPVPHGFIISSKAYFTFLVENNLTTKIKHLLSTTDFNLPESVLQTSLRIKQHMTQAHIPSEITKEILTSYKQFGGIIHNPPVVVRSSATTEDQPHASFAGLQESYLHVKGDANLLIKIKDVWASLFEARAITYRHEKGFNHGKIGMAVVVQKMIHADKAGVLFTVDPVTNNPKKMIIEAVYGLGEYLVQGHITPDHYEVNKQDIFILQKNIGSQEAMLTYTSDKKREITLSKNKGERQKLSDKEIMMLAEYGKNIEKHSYFNQDIEWAIEKNKIFILQTRPITTLDVKKQQAEHTITNAILKGISASPGIVSGKTKFLKKDKPITVTEKEILIIDDVSLTYRDNIKHALAVISSHGGKSSLAGIFARNNGIPAVLGVKTAEEKIKEGQIITVNGTKGEIYTNGYFPFHNSGEKEQSYVTATKIFVDIKRENIANVSLPSYVSGIGLLKSEDLQKQSNIHPKKSINDGKKEILIEQIVSVVETLAHKGNNKPIFYQANNANSSMMKKLAYGKDYEPSELNPLLGYHGAFRLIHDTSLFTIDMEVIKRLRNKRNIKNVWLVLPFVRSVRELQELKKLIASNNLYRSPTFKIFLSIDTPAVADKLETFLAQGIDGCILNADMLASLLLGVEPDNTEVASLYTQSDSTVLNIYGECISKAHKNNTPIFIQGETIYHYPQLIEYVVEKGISGVITNEHYLPLQHEIIMATERKLLSKKN